MALTTERIRELWENYSPTKGIESFARAIEAAHGIAHKGGGNVPSA